MFKKNTWKPIKIWLRQNPPPLITFISDDGWAKDFSLLKSLSDKYEIPFTTALITGWLGTNTSWLTIDEVNILYNTGRWEFISHTSNHPHLSLLSDSDLEQTLRQSKEWLISRNLGKGYKYIAYPYGEYDNRVIEATMKYYKLGISGDYGLNSTQIDSYNVKRVYLGAFAKEGQNTIAYYTSKIDEAIINRQWLIFTLHSGIAGHNNDDLEAVIQYAQSKKVPIVTVDTAVKYYKSFFTSDKRIEKTNSNIIYIGNWSEENDIKFSDGSEKYASAEVIQLLLHFTVLELDLFLPLTLIEEL